jgi:hypothetical protein
MALAVAPYAATPGKDTPTRSKHSFASELERSPAR